MRLSQNAPAASWLATVAAISLSMAFAHPAQAVPVLVVTEGLPGIDVAQRDSAGMLRLFDADDDNADGTISFVADLDPLHDPAVHIKSGPSKSQTVILLILADRNFNEPTPFFITGTDDRVITHWNSLPTTPFTLGQPFSVSGGQIPGLDATVYRSPGVGSAAEVVDLDLTTLPLYTGPLLVGGLLRYQVVAEPSGAMLLAFGSGAFATLGFSRRRRAVTSVRMQRPHAS